MNTQTNTKPVEEIAEVQTEVENPMQERHIGQVAESVELAAETVFTVRRLENREETGPVFVP